MNRTLLVLEDLLAPLPGSDVTAMEALSFLFSAARDFQSRTQIRQRAAARSATVSTTLHTLMADGRIERTSGSCWRLVNDDA